MHRYCKDENETINVGKIFKIKTHEHFLGKLLEQGL
jgi:hypothetical protein